MRKANWVLIGEKPETVATQRIVAGGHLYQAHRHDCPLPRQRGRFYGGENRLEPGDRFVCYRCQATWEWRLDG